MDRHEGTPGTTGGGLEVGRPSDSSEVESTGVVGRVPMAAVPESAIITGELPIAPAYPTGRDTGGQASSRPGPTPSGNSSWVPRSNTGLRVAVGCLGLVLLVSVIGLVVLHVHPAWFDALRNADHPTATSVPPPAASKPPAKPIRRQAGGPTLYSITPANGPSGATVTISGADLFSADGHLVALFGGTVASTRCPSEERCVAVVPPSATSRTVSVRLRTAAGLSNPLTFRYG